MEVMDDVVQKANVLVEALPYIRTFFGKTFVVKYGGSAMQDSALRKAFCLDMILLKYVGLNPVIVHGGGPDISRFLKRLGKETTFVDGLRVTDAETMEIVQMVLVGKINQSLVSTINQYGGRALGLSGLDGNLIVARKHTAGKKGPDGDNREPVDLGYVGDVDKINPEIVSTLSAEGYIPVISPIGVGYHGETYNINADAVAGELAAALHADKLIMLTDVEGIYEDPEREDTLISALQIERARTMVATGQIQGGMIPKVEACIRALEAGVTRTHIIDGRRLHSLLLEVFTDRGIGTMVIA